MHWSCGDELMAVLQTNATQKHTGKGGIQLSYTQFELTENKLYIDISPHAIELFPARSWFNEETSAESYQGEEIDWVGGSIDRVLMACVCNVCLYRERGAQRERGGGGTFSRQWGLTFGALSWNPLFLTITYL